MAPSRWPAAPAQEVWTTDRTKCSDFGVELGERLHVALVTEAGQNHQHGGGDGGMDRLSNRYRRALVRFTAYQRRGDVDAGQYVPQVGFGKGMCHHASSN